MSFRYKKIAIPDDFLRNFKVNNFLKHIFISSNAENNSAVSKWLQDLSLMCENECLCVLQAKSLTGKIVRI